MSILFSDASEHLTPIRSRAFTPRYLPASLVLILTLFISTPVSSANFEYGLDAANRGDYVTALKQWTPLAEEGFAHAQNSLGNKLPCSVVQAGVLNRLMVEGPLPTQTV